MNTKRNKGEGEYVYLTMPQWIKHTYMLYKRNVITDCIRELMAEKLIKRRSIKVHDQNTFEYTLNLDELNDRIKKLPAKPPKETQPNLDDYLAFEDRAKAKRAKNKQEEEGVREKSPTQKSTKKVREKSPTVGEKSQEVGEKPTQHSIPTQSSNLDSTTGEDSEHTQTTAPVVAPPPDAAIKTMFEALAKEHFGPDYTVILPKAGSDVYGIMTELAERKPLLDEMRRVYLSLYNKQDSSGEYWWRDPNRLTFCAFLRGYNKQLEALNKPTRTNTPKSSSPGLHRASNGFCTPEYVRKLATMTPEQRRAEAKAKREARLAQQQQEQQNV
jgi:hypothetical protein